LLEKAESAPGGWHLREIRKPEGKNYVSIKYYILFGTTIVIQRSCLKFSAEGEKTAF
jgi:hypothetical protein